MRITNILVQNKNHLAVMTERGVIDATAAGCALTLEELIRGADRAELEAIALDSSLPIVPEPVFGNLSGPSAKLLCVGLNYRAHADGIADGVHFKSAEFPILFSKFSDSLVPSGAYIELPPWEKSYDYEAELVIVIGKDTWNVSEKNAMDSVFGYTCGNDISCRAPQMRTSQWLIGKAMPGFGPCGPCITTADSLDPSAGAAVRSYVNGELRQNGNTRDMIFSCAKIISYASKYIHLHPGDLIFTGTPSGVALEQREDKRRWVEPGDRVDITIEGIGTLTNELM